MAVSIKDEEVPSELENYWLSLGRFIHRFASLETKLQTTLWIIADTPPQTAKAIFSGVRSDTARDFINRIREARGDKKNDYLERAFQQIAIITRVRNDIVHYGAEFSQTDFVVSNEKAAMPGRERVTPVSSEILDDLTADLRTIQACLNMFLYSVAVMPSESAQPLWDQIAQRPWRYKSPQQSGAHQKRSPRKPKHKSPPRSSGA